MASVFVTGSADGIGAETARLLVAGGHRVVLHARDERRAAAAEAAVPGAAGVAVGDLASLTQTRGLATAATDLGPYDAVVHNAGISGPRRRTTTEDGLEQTFQVNVLAPYLLTALMPLPDRLIYLTSGMASGGVVDLDDLQRERRRWDATGAYCDSKLCDLALAFAVARRCPQVLSNAVCPGWVRSRMGGPSAPTDLRTGAATQAWLAAADDPAARMTGRYLRHMRLLDPPPAASDSAVQDGLLAACARLGKVELPG
ncbi:SDR family NAD(P)-dependent oxidoreductase [Planosporangium sp. 12N6]|uniref:SDR family NAD(P)-dependent oxidoreductase n=1 Tax=Planosporangium spinosum TaxID=3402278 RepID=UPI003CF043CB